MADFFPPDDSDGAAIASDPRVEACYTVHGQITVNRLFSVPRVSRTINPTTGTMNRDNPAVGAQSEGNASNPASGGTSSLPGSDVPHIQLSFRPLSTESQAKDRVEEEVEEGMDASTSTEPEPSEEKNSGSEVVLAAEMRIPPQALAQEVMVVDLPPTKEPTALQEAPEKKVKEDEEAPAPHSAAEKEPVVPQLPEEDVSPSVPHTELEATPLPPGKKPSVSQLLPENEEKIPPLPPETEPLPPGLPPDMEPSVPQPPPQKEEKVPQLPGEMEPSVPQPLPESEQNVPQLPQETEPSVPQPLPESEQNVPQLPRETEPSVPQPLPESEQNAPQLPRETEPSVPQPLPESEQNAPQLPRETEPSVPQPLPESEQNAPQLPRETEPSVPQPLPESEQNAPQLPREMEPSVPYPLPESEQNAPQLPRETEPSVPHPLLKREAPAPHPQVFKEPSLPQTATEMEPPVPHPGIFKESPLLQPAEMEPRMFREPLVPRTPVEVEPPILRPLKETSVPPLPPVRESVAPLPPAMKELLELQSLPEKPPAFKEHIAPWGTSLYRFERPAFQEEKGTMSRSETKAWPGREGTSASVLTYPKPKPAAAAPGGKGASLNDTVEDFASHLREVGNASKSAMASSISSFVASPVGRVFAHTIDRALDKSEQWLDYYLPVMESDDESSTAAEEEHDTASEDLCKEGCFMRLNTLSTKLRSRALRLALQQLKTTRQATRENLPVLDQILDVLDRSHGQNLLNISSVPESLNNLWAPSTPKQEPSRHTKTLGTSINKAPSIVPELELKALDLTRTLAQQLYDTYHDLLPHFASLPAHLQEKAIRVYENMEELQSHFTASRSLRDLPSSLVIQSRQKMAMARDNLDEILDFMGQNPAVHWLSQPDSSSKGKQPASAAAESQPKGRSPERKAVENPTSTQPPSLPHL